MRSAKVRPFRRRSLRPCAFGAAEIVEGRHTTLPRPRCRLPVAASSAQQRGGGVRGSGGASPRGDDGDGSDGVDPGALPVVAPGKHRTRVYSSLGLPSFPASSCSSGPRSTGCDGSNNNDSHPILMDYVRGWAWQQALLSRRLSIRSAARGREEEPPAPADDDDDPDTAQCRGSSNRDDDDPDVVLILEHDHVYTLGRGADENHLTFLSDPGVAGKGGASPRLDEIRRRLARTSRGAGSARLSVDRRIGAAGGGRDGRDGATEARERTEAALEAVVERLCEGVRPVVAPNGVPIFRVERGGECTYHGPGQLVCYPMLDLKRQEKADLHDYLRSVEEVVIRTLDEYGIRGARDDANTGVWVGRDKIAAVGVSSSRWITTHGFALNVRPDLAYFDTSVILPCGIDGRGVTSIDVVLRKQGRDAPTVHEVSRVVLEHLTQVFDLDVESIRDISATERNSPQLLVC